MRFRLRYGRRGDFITNYGVELDDEEIQEMIDGVLEEFEKEPVPGNFHYIATGNVCVIGLFFKDEIEIIVSKNYEEASIYEEDGKWKVMEWYEDDYRKYPDYNPRREA